MSISSKNRVKPLDWGDEQSNDSGLRSAASPGENTVFTVPQSVSENVLDIVSEDGVDLIPLFTSYACTRIYYNRLTENRSQENDVSVARVRTVEALGRGRTRARYCLPEQASRTSPESQGNDVPS